MSSESHQIATHLGNGFQWKYSLLFGCGVITELQKTLALPLAVILLVFESYCTTEIGQQGNSKGHGNSAKLKCHKQWSLTEIQEVFLNG